MAENTRYERKLFNYGGLSAQMAAASRYARDSVPVDTAHEAAIRNVAAGMAAPVLTGYVLWLLNQARTLDLGRLCFLSRDAQVLHEIAEAISPKISSEAELHYVYSSRRTWSLAASDPKQLNTADWLFNSFIRSNAEDVCARLGLELEEFSQLVTAAGASLDPGVRADSAEQNAALRRFVALPDVASALASRVASMRELVLEYAQQEGMASAATGLVDAGWTGRMVGAFHTVLTEASLPLPPVFFWGHEHRKSGGADLQMLHPYMYSTIKEPGMQWRIPDNPYIIETFCMSDHSIVSGYTRTTSGRITAELEQTNAAVSGWGFGVYRAAIGAFCEALELTGDSSKEDIRPVLSSVLRDFWITPDATEALAWGAYPYDSDPIGRSTLPLARNFTAEELASANDANFNWGDRAWLQGSLALSGEPGRRAAEVLAERYEQLGGPAPD